MKRAIVIGATSGIGRGLAECFAAQGYAVGLVGRRENLLKEIAQADPAAYRFAVADVTRPAETVAALEHLAQELGGMDLCVVCAGTGDLNPSLDFALEETAILTNVLGWTAAADWAYNRFERQGGGHLVVVSSVGGLRGGERLRPTTPRKPIRSTTPRDCGSALRNPDSRFTSPTSVRASSIRRWPRVTVCSG